MHTVHIACHLKTKHERQPFCLFTLADKQRTMRGVINILDMIC